MTIMDPDAFRISFRVTWQAAEDGLEELVELTCRVRDQVSGFDGRLKEAMRSAAQAAGLDIPTLAGVFERKQISRSNGFVIITGKAYARPQGPDGGPA